MEIQQDRQMNATPLHHGSSHDLRIGFVIIPILCRPCSSQRAYLGVLQNYSRHILLLACYPFFLDARVSLI